MSEQINMNKATAPPPSQNDNKQMVNFFLESGAAGQFLENWGKQCVSRLEHHR
jgi:hypothetical protein